MSCVNSPVGQETVGEVEAELGMFITPFLKHLYTVEVRRADFVPKSLVVTQSILLFFLISFNPFFTLFLTLYLRFYAAFVLQSGFLCASGSVNSSRIRVQGVSLGCHTDYPFVSAPGEGVDV